MRPPIGFIRHSNHSDTIRQSVSVLLAHERLDPQVGTRESDLKAACVSVLPGPTGLHLPMPRADRCLAPTIPASFLGWTLRYSHTGSSLAQPPPVPPPFHSLPLGGGGTTI